MSEAVLEVRDLVVAYGGRPALEVAHLAVRRGETLTIVGPNGAGKSTLLRVLALLEAPTRGTVRFGDAAVRYDSRTLLALRRRTAVVFQSPLLCDTSVHDNVALGLRFRRRSAEEIERRVRPWLERFGILHLAARSARTLSGGEAQRTALARAFVLEPEILFLDEPFGALDLPTREALLLDLNAALQQPDMTTVFITHDRTEALMLGDRVAVVMGGRVAQLDAPDRVFSAPASEEVARFVGADSILPGVVRANQDDLCRVAVEGGEVEVHSDAAVGEAVLVCLRPEDVTLSPVDAPGVLTSARNSLVGKVGRRVPLGPLVRVPVQAGFEIQALITKR
ncbi:MAG: ABC transporter ATP-binding protein, partial [Candidatus Rokuibacteriota bacterium]